MLIANVPLAVVYSAIGIQMLTSYRVTIVNRSSSELKNVRLDGGGIQENIGVLHPGQTKRLRVHAQQDGELRLTALRNHDKIDEVVSGYVTNGGSGSHRVTVTDESVVVTGR